MKNSQKFIIEKLNNLYSSLIDVKIRYEFREYMSTHLIEILPLETFENNQDYILIEMEIQDEFECSFGENEEILFISSDSLNEIRDIHYSLGYNIIEKIMPTVLFPHAFSFNEFDTIITEDNTSYALAA
jgi:hypothetical protein